MRRLGTGVFLLVLATGLRGGELQTLHWSDLDLAHRRVHVRTEPQYRFLPKDWEERTVPFSKEVAEILRQDETAVLKTGESKTKKAHSTRGGASQHIPK